MIERILLIACVPFIAAWSPFDQTSKVDGSRRVGVERSQTVQTYEGGRTFQPMIQIECRNGVSYVFLHFDRVMSGRGQSIAYRVDTGTPKRIWMTNTTDYKAFGVSGRAAVLFAQELIDGKQLHVRATPYNSGAIEITFEIDGLRDAVKDVANACKWAAHLRAAKADAAAGAEMQKYLPAHRACFCAEMYKYRSDFDKCLAPIPAHLHKRIMNSRAPDCSAYRK